MYIRKEWRAEALLRDKSKLSPLLILSMLGYSTFLNYIRNQSCVIKFRLWCSSLETGSWLIHAVQGQIQGVCLWFYTRFTRHQVNNYFSQITYVKVVSKGWTKKVASEEWKHKFLQIQKDQVCAFGRGLFLQSQFHMWSIEVFQ